jgi:ABC-type transporter Mla subunit MlaD
LVTKSGETLSEIVSSVKRVTDIIGEIAAASQEQSTGIDQVNRAVTQMDAVVQSNAAQTEELSSTAQALTAQARQLQSLVAKFKVGQGSDRPAAPERRETAKPKTPPQPERHARVTPKAPEPTAFLPRGNGSLSRYPAAFEEF